MEVHEATKLGIEAYIEKIKAQAIPRKEVAPFQDPIREFARASKVESIVRNWLTYPIEERKRIIKSSFIFVPKQPGNPGAAQKPETEQEFEGRQMERWRALCVIIQEESRAAAGNRSPEVAIGALKLLFPEHEWKVPPQGQPKA